MKKINVYVDGACSGNPGPGGWAVVFNLDTECKQYSGGEPDTTNNRMELMAMLKCLERILSESKTDTVFEIYSDSAYVVNPIIKKWLYTWEDNGWCTKTKETVKNRDLWKKIAGYVRVINDSGYKVMITKIKGHAGNSFNELCDKLAKEEAQKARTGREEFASEKGGKYVI